MSGQPSRPAGECVATADRILVLGSPGAGKSTFARRLGSCTGLPVHHLDDEYWAPGWSRPSAQCWERRLTTLVEGDRWIVDGNYLPTLPLRARRAELVVLFDAPVLTCLARVLLRAWRIRRGDHRFLPARVRAAAAAGRPTAASRDLGPLVRMVLRFRRDDWWRTAECVRATGGAALLVAVVPGRLWSRTSSVRRRLRRGGVPAEVLPLAEAVRLTCSRGRTYR